MQQPDTARQLAEQIWAGIRTDDLAMLNAAEQTAAIAELIRRPLEAARIQAETATAQAAAARLTLKQMRAVARFFANLLHAAMEERHITKRDLNRIPRMREVLGLTATGRREDGDDNGGEE